MSEQLTIEQAVAVLNEAKWRGQDDWTLWNLAGRYDETDWRVTSVEFETYVEQDAIAIATGILDARALAEARERIGELEREANRLGRYINEDRVAILNADARFVKLKAEVEQLRAERNSWEAAALASQDERDETARHYAALRSAIAPFIEVAKKVYSTGWTYDAQDMPMEHWKALAALGEQPAKEKI